MMKVIDWKFIKYTPLPFIAFNIRTNENDLNFEEYDVEFIVSKKLTSFDLDYEMAKLDNINRENDVINLIQSKNPARYIVFYKAPQEVSVIRRRGRVVEEEDGTVYREPIGNFYVRYGVI